MKTSPGKNSDQMAAAWGHIINQVCGEAEEGKYGEGHFAITHTILGNMVLLLLSLKRCLRAPPGVRWKERRPQASLQGGSATFTKPAGGGLRQQPSLRSIRIGLFTLGSKYTLAPFAGVKGSSSTPAGEGHS